jgi:superfamily II DNA or RNA helicase
VTGRDPSDASDGPLLPPGAAVAPTAARQVLERFFGRLDLDGAALDHIVGLARETAIAAAGKGTTRVRVGDATLTTFEPLEAPGDALDTHCERCALADRFCEHQGALLIALAWRHGRWRARLERPAWETSLGGLRAPNPSADDEIPAPAPPDARHDGYLRYVIHDPATPRHRAARRDGPIGRRVCRRARRGGRALNPKPFYGPYEVAELEIRGLVDVDRRLDRLITELDGLQLIEAPDRDTAERLARLSRRLLAEAVPLLADATEVWLDQRPVEVAPEVAQPRLVVADAHDGGLVLRWAPPVARVVDLDPPCILTPDDVLHVLDADTPRALVEQLGTTLPPVPAADVARFTAEALPELQVPVTVEASRVEIVAADTVTLTPRLLLRADDRLRIDLRFAYALGDAVHVVEAAAPVAFFRLGPRAARRNPAAERLWEAKLRARIGGAPFPIALRGEAAYDFLFDALQPLADDGFEVHADATLARWRPRGAAAPRVTFEAGEDWFDLEARFEIEGLEIPAGDIIATWRRGERYVPLNDGRVARLPMRWLARHGDALEELFEVRAALKEKLGVFALPLAAKLIEQVDSTSQDAALARWRGLHERLSALSRLPERAVPEGLNADLRPYQHLGFRWLAMMRDLGLGCVLADDMGLGKTLQAIALLLDTHRAAETTRQRGGTDAHRCSLVVAPTSVVHNWAEELRRFAPGLRVSTYQGATRALPDWSDTDVVLTSYALLRRDASQFVGRQLRHLVLDEAHFVKNSASKTARTVRALRADHRLALTGTPLENHLSELWSLFQCILPGFFGPQAAFNRRYAVPIQRDRATEAMDRLRARVRPFVLRRLKDEVARELPPRIEALTWCTLGPEQRALYERVRETWRDVVLRGTRAERRGRDALQVLEALTRLRQACCDPRLLPFEDAAGVVGSAKLDRLMELLHVGIEDGHRTLVFSQWPSFLRLVVERLDAAGIDHLYLDGGTRHRGALVASWNEPSGPPVFLISLKAGGAGLNLTAADHVVLLDPWWNPAAEQQAIDRAHRIGQTRPVVVHRLVARGTVEERVLALQARKRALFSATVDDDRQLAESLDLAELRAVFAPDTDEAGQYAADRAAAEASFAADS